MGAQRRRVTWEVKGEAVRLTWERGRSVADVARELGIRPDLRHEGRRAVAVMCDAQRRPSSRRSGDEVRRHHAAPGAVSGLAHGPGAPGPPGLASTPPRDGRPATGRSEMPG